MIVDIVDKYLTDDNNPIKNLRLKTMLNVSVNGSKIEFWDIFHKKSFFNFLSRSLPSKMGKCAYMRKTFFFVKNPNG
jgi:hypothetical protein